MKTFNKLAIVMLAITFAFGLNGPTPALAAATAPTLGAMSSFSVLADSSMAANGAGVTVSGAMGLSTGLAGSRTGTWLPASGRVEYFGPSSLAKTAQDDATTAKTFMANEPSDGTWSLNPNPAPGVWTAAGSPTFAGTLTLNGSASDIWVFQLTTDFTFTGNVVLTGGAQACNVFWQIGQDATINRGADAGNKFVGTLIAGRTVTLVGGVTVNGRIIAGPAGSFTGAGGDSISGPTCAAVVYSSTARTGTINVVKTVINDSGGTRTVADFPLFVNGVSVVSGVTNTFRAPAGVYAVTETSDSHYARSFSGDCDVNGNLNLNPGDNKFCIITNNDIGAPIVALVPPLIDVVKVPSPLSLPNGPGLVNYTYTLRNIGTVPVTDITMVGDTCSPIVLVSGDTNHDGKLDLNETWVHTCSTNLTETHTNTVVATGWANGLSATDIASANVVVGLPIVPPLIHVTKVPAPFTLSAGGGLVTYTEKITNPGTVALSNVKISDDKCSNVIYLSGDTNNNSKLDTTETWTYTCKTNLTKTTMNTVSVTGEANGLIARDFAIATVVVAAVVPTLPNTGLPEATSTPWGMIALSGIIILALTSSILVLKKRA